MPPVSGWKCTENKLHLSMHGKPIQIGRIVCSLHLTWIWPHIKTSDPYFKLWQPSLFATARLPQRVPFQKVAASISQKRNSVSAWACVCTSNFLQGHGVVKILYQTVSWEPLVAHSSDSRIGSEPPQGWQQIQSWISGINSWDLQLTARMRTTESEKDREREARNWM